MRFCYTIKLLDARAKLIRTWKVSSLEWSIQLNVFFAVVGKKLKNIYFKWNSETRWIKNVSTNVSVCLKKRLTVAFEYNASVYRQFNGAKFHVNDDYSTEINQVTFNIFFLYLSVHPSHLLIQFWFFIISSQVSNYFFLKKWLF